MKSILNIFFLGLITFLFSAVPNEAEAQFSFRSEAYALDTLTNTASATFTFSKNLEEQFDAVLNIYNTELSGTATLTAIVQQTACASCSTWINTDTITITATGNHSLVLTGEEFWGYRARVSFATSGTGSHAFNAILLLRRRNMIRYG